MRETSEMFNLPQTTIRFWEREFELLKPHKNAKGTRFFRPEDIKTLHLIYFLMKEQGMTMRGAKKRLLTAPEKTIRQFEISTKLLEVKEQLLQIKSHLD